MPPCSALVLSVFYFQIKKSQKINWLQHTKQFKNEGSRRAQCEPLPHKDKSVCVLLKGRGTDAAGVKLWGSQAGHQLRPQA